MASFVRESRALLTLPVLLAGLTCLADDKVPPRSDGGQALVIPAEHLELGEVYHITPGTGTQLMWHGETPLLRATATCNRIVGYFVAPFDVEEGQTPLLVGAFRLPVASLSAGIAQYDGQLHGPQALNKAAYPEITFRMTGVTDVKTTGEEGTRQSYTLKLAGELTVKDKTVTLQIPMQLTFQPFTWGTMQLGMGDRLILRGRCEVKLADIGLVPQQGRSDPDMNFQVGEFDFYLLCSTMSPERNLYPDITHEQYRKQLRFVTLLRDFDDPEKGYEFGRTFMRESWDDAKALNRLAWATLTEDGIKTRDLAFAMKAVQRASELTGSKDADVLNTLARVYYEKGELEAALKWQRQAAEHLEGADPQVTGQVRSALERYEAQVKKSQE
ncbi:MAG TPA: YceI family protein [Phycisphaerae bacterium]|nr:YceI family protein [Phycisphaerae bacterium]